MTIKNSAPPSYDEVFGNISKDEPPQYQDIVHEEWMHQNIDFHNFSLILNQIAQDRLYLKWYQDYYKIAINLTEIYILNLWI